VSNHLIYSLADPRKPDEVRYIGQTGNDAHTRQRQHVNYSRYLRRHGKPESDVATWINHLLQEGLEPTISVLQQGLTFDEAVAAEMRYVETLLPFGILNHPNIERCRGGKKMGQLDSDRGRRNKSKSWENGRATATAHRGGYAGTPPYREQREAKGYPFPDLQVWHPQNIEHYAKLWAANYKTRIFNPTTQAKHQARRLQRGYPRPDLVVYAPENIFYHYKHGRYL
jgi:hypothetical protein